MTDWEGHYRAGDMPWNKGAPSPALLEALEIVPMSGRMLVPGCGLGHDVPPLLARATEVVGIDVAPSAVEGATRQHGGGHARFVLQDLFTLPESWKGSFDWVWEHTCFCAIDPSLRPAYVQAVADALGPGGQFLAVFYLDPGQPTPQDGPPFETSLAELDRLFAPAFTLVREWLPTRAYPGREGREWMRWYRRTGDGK